MNSDYLDHRVPKWTTYHLCTGRTQNCRYPKQASGRYACPSARANSLLEISFHIHLSVFGLSWFYAGDGTSGGVPVYHSKEKERMVG